MALHQKAGNGLCVEEGFRYYVGFPGSLNLERVISSYSTNVECRFGGLKGTPLKEGAVFNVSARLNRTGIRLDGKPLTFKE